MTRVRQPENVGTFRNNQTGFGAMEMLMALVIVVLIAVAGWLVLKNHSKTPTSPKGTVKTLQQDLSNNNAAGPNQSQYAGWQPFCSSYGGLCLRYPSNWQFNQATFSPGQSITGQEVDTFTSPSGNVKVSYMPSAQVTGDRQTENIQVVGSTATAVSALEVVRLIDQIASSPTIYGVEDYVTLTSAAHALNGTNFSTGATIANTSEPPYHQFTNPVRPGDLGQQLLAVTENGNAASTNQFSSAAAAQAWLSSSEVQTAGQILDSVTYSQ